MPPLKKVVLMISSVVAVLLLLAVESGATLSASFALGPTINNVGGIDINYPKAIATDAVRGKLYISDAKNNRVLRYDDYTTLTPSSSPTMVWGQPNFSSGNAPNISSPSNLKHPIGLCIDDNGDLWVADSGFNRVVKYASPADEKPSAYGSIADVVLGGTGIMDTPFGLSCAQGSLWVADQLSSR